MRVFVSTDIEGITGLVSFSQCGGPTADRYDWAFARRMYSHDLNAAVRGARAAGATKVVVKDAHGACKNLLVEDLEPEVELISGAGPTPEGMMEGIDPSFDAAILLGYHAMAGMERGLMDHALVGGVHRFWLNDEEAGEILVSAMAAWECGVPLVAVTGDDAACEEAHQHVPGVRTYATKSSYGRYMAKLNHPSVTGAGIQEAVRLGISDPPAVPTLPAETTMRAQFRTTTETELAADLTDVRRIDGYTLEWTCRSFKEAHRLAYAVFALSIQARSLES